MSGKRLHSFRSGDRSEYLANYLFSCFAYSVPLLRQEDFGVADFLCVLDRNDDNLVYPENGFYVQVKSDEKDIVFDSDSAAWISNHMNLPLLVGVINKNGSHLKLYSTSKAWVGLFLIPNPQKMTLKLNLGTDEQVVGVDFKTHELMIRIGEPIISLSIDEIESTPDICRCVLKTWLQNDELNIARRCFGRMFCTFFINWKPNEIPRNTIHQYTYGSEYPKTEKDIAQILTALAYGYRLNKQKDRLYSIVQFMSHIEEYLDEPGKKFLSGEYCIEE